MRIGVPKLMQRLSEAPELADGANNMAQNGALDIEIDRETPARRPCSRSASLKARRRAQEGDRQTELQLAHPGQINRRIAKPQKLSYDVQIKPTES